MKRSTIPLSLTLVFALTLSACGGGFASNLRTILAASTPLVDALVASGAIKPALRDTYLKDFSDLASGAAQLKDDLDACPIKGNSCKLDAVDKFQAVFFGVANRGNFIKVEKLAKVQAILEGIIAAARIHYGAPVKRGEQVRPLDDLLKELKAEMKA